MCASRTGVSERPGFSPLTQEGKRKRRGGPEKGERSWQQAPLKMPQARGGRSVPQVQAGDGEEGQSPPPWAVEAGEEAGSSQEKGG